MNSASLCSLMALFACGKLWRSSKLKDGVPKQEAEENAAATVQASQPVRSVKGGLPDKAYTPEQEAAAGKIGAAVRGSATRWQVKEDYHETRFRAEGSPVEPEELGFCKYAQKNASMPVVSDHLRFKVRDLTKHRVMEQLCQDEVFGSWSTFEFLAAKLLEKVATSGARELPPGPRKQMASVHLFQGEMTSKPKRDEAEGFLRRQDTYLLGKFQVVAVPAVADYDAAFGSLEVAPKADCDGPEGFNGWFWVLHTAAPNIGESAQAEDFLAYSVEEEIGNERPFRVASTNSAASTNSRCCWKDRPSRPSRRLNEDLYIADIARLWRNALKAVQHLEVEDAIFFPFGMGAFLRHLHLNDDRYEDPARMRTLKRRIADELMNAIADICIRSKSGPNKATRRSCNVHLCLVCVNPESIDNHNCFVEAAASKVQSCPALKDVLQLRRNVDSLQLAHELGSNGRLKVALLNGANRKLCGNHWFQSGARYAIDENLHRRSASLSRASLLVNFDTEPRPRKATQLEETIRFFGGSVVDLTKENREKQKVTDLKHVQVQEIASTPAPEAKPKKSFCFCCAKESLAQE